MSELPVELSEILGILKENPRGMSVTDIAGAIKVNRNTVSRYLDMLLISGQVEMKAYGKAKVFYLSQRVPISAMVNFSSDMVIVLDRSMNVMQVNDALCSFMGVERDDITGKPMRNSPLAAFDHPLITSTIRDAMEGTQTVDELRFLRGYEEFFFGVRIISTVFNDGSPGVTIILEDITEKKRAEEALRESELTYRKLVEEINDSIWNIDENLEFTYVSPRTTDIIGYSPEGLIGRSLYSVVDAADEVRLRQALAAHSAGPGSLNLMEFAAVHKDGMPVSLEANISSRFDEIGNFVGYRLVCRDVTERKQAMKRVTQWKSFLHSIVQNIPAMVMVRELKDNQFVFFNQAVYDAFGDYCEVIAEKLFPVVYGTSTETLEVDVPEIGVEVPGRGIRVFQTKSVPILHSGNKYRFMLGIVHDITEQKRAEELIIEQRDLAQGYLDVAGVMIAVVGCDGKINCMNRKGSSLLGYDEGALIGKDWFNTLVPDRIKGTLKENFGLLMSGTEEPPSGAPGIMKAKDGREIGVIWHNTLLRDTKGNIVAMVSSAEVHLPDSCGNSA